ncbi:arginine--tRNA ligase [Candidatus Gracilibacteria bacterium]|nr:arginine--tRNA ligase [Candidatus Gracilibacteria bacterium]
MTIKEQIKSILEKAVKKTLKNNSDEISVQYPSDLSHGDYATNIAMKLGKIMQKNPREIAEQIVKNIPKNTLIEKVGIAGPGFINFFISEKNLKIEMAKVLKEKAKYSKSNEGKKKTVIVEYSSPNIAKPLGVHHLLSTIIGQTLNNILDAIGYKTISINHIGDWGTQFGKLIYAYKKWGNKTILEKDPINEMLKLYVKFHEVAEKDPSLEDAARKEFKDFEEGEKENRKLWEWFVKESLKDMNKTYKKLSGIKFDYTLGESFYEDKMDELLEEGKKKKIFVEGDEGSYIAKFDDENMSPMVVQKKDGATLYSTRDMTTLKYRITRWKPEKILYVVDMAQNMYFKQLFETAKRFSWYKDEGFHVSFGRMRMEDMQMSTRKGNIILLDSVLEEAIKRAKKIIEEKSPNLKNKDKIAEIVGIGSVKYNILSQNRSTDIVFDWDKMLSLEGNSAPYLQYTYARAHSILRKAKTAKVSVKTDENKNEIAEKISHILRMIPKFKEQLIFSAHEYKPNLLSQYLYELAQKFNSFYNSVPVLTAKNKKEKIFRLQVTQSVSQILKNGLALLGVEVVEEM